MNTFITKFKYGGEKILFLFISRFTSQKQENHEKNQSAGIISSREGIYSLLKQYTKDRTTKKPRNENYIDNKLCLNNPKQAFLKNPKRNTRTTE